MSAEVTTRRMIFDPARVVPLAQQAGVWGARVYQALRWLEHKGLIARVRRPRNTRNKWHVVELRAEVAGYGR